jgi:phosphoribosylamine--glycine ligase
MSENILVIGEPGGSAATHQLGMELLGDDQSNRLSFIGGNAGTQELGRNYEIPATDADSVVAHICRQQYDLTVVASRALIQDAVADRVRARRLPVFGPGVAAAQLEGSQLEAFRFLISNGLPMPNSSIADTPAEVSEQINNYYGRDPDSFVIKSDAPANAGGVYAPATIQSAIARATQLLSSDTVGRRGLIIQKKITGRDVSLHVLSDGTNHAIVPAVVLDSVLPTDAAGRPPCG